MFAVSDGASASDSSAKKEEETLPRNFLRSPITKAAVRILSERILKEEAESKPEPVVVEPESEPEPVVAEPVLPPTNSETAKTILLALLMSGLGALAIAYPHFFDDFDPHYIRGNDFSYAFGMLTLIMLFKLSWNQIGGTIVVALSLFAIAKSITKRVIGQQ